MNKLVFSKTLQNATWKNSRVLHELDRHEIETLKNQPGKNMILFGSGSIVSQLTQHGLIDEYQFVVCPIFVGSGRPLLSHVSKNLKLDLLEAKPYRSGDVLLRYARRLDDLDISALAEGFQLCRLRVDFLSFRRTQGSRRLFEPRCDLRRGQNDANFLTMFTTRTRKTVAVNGLSLGLVVVVALVNRTVAS